MTFKNYNQLNELFDKPYKYETTPFGYQFFVNDDHYEIVVKPRIYSFGPGMNIRGKEISFTKNGNDRMDTAEDPFRVFATVIDAFKNENLSDTEYITFTAYRKEKSRVKLYNKMVKVFTKKLKWDSYKIAEEGSNMSYTIYKYDYSDVA